MAFNVQELKDKQVFPMVLRVILRLATKGEPGIYVSKQRTHPWTCSTGAIGNEMKYLSQEKALSG